MDLKPRLLLSMYAKGINRSPNEIPGPARILAMSDANIAFPIAEWEVMLARSISRVAFLWNQALQEDTNFLARMVNIDKGGRIFSGPDYRNAEKHLNLHVASGNYTPIFLELRKLLHITDSIVLHETPVERALQRYKLGIEVMTPEILEKFTDKSELRLQKELCRFLIECGIYAVGTKFGRSETDLMAEVTECSYIIETKIYRQYDTLSEGSLRKNLAQLQNYMDQSPTPRRGILVIYNMSDCLLDAPRIWLRHRYWILAINLQSAPPSQRRKTLTVEQTDNGELIRVVSNQPPKKRSHRSKTTPT